VSTKGKHQVVILSLDYTNQLTTVK